MQKMLRDGDLNDILIKNIGSGVRQPWLKGLAQRNASMI